MTKWLRPDQETGFAILHIFRYLEASGSSMFSLFCTVLTPKRQNSENDKLPDSSKTVKPVVWSQTLYLLYQYMMRLPHPLNMCLYSPRLRPMRDETLHIVGLVSERLASVCFQSPRCRPLVRRRVTWQWRGRKYFKIFKGLRPFWVV